jgi:hypothetical protein
MHIHLLLIHTSHLSWQDYENAFINVQGSSLVGVFCTDKNKVVKIAHFNSETVLRTTKRTMIRGYNGVSRELDKFTW